MDDCCVDKACAVELLRERQATTLRLVLVANASMFAVELVSGLLAGSVALLADSLDMLGDALVYGFSLYVVGKSLMWKARAAVAKAALMGLFGVFVFGQVVYKLLYPQLPTVETMGVVGALALTVNGACSALLRRHRAEDINMRSVWLCSRNDLVANVSVLLAAWAVWFTLSPWPDIAVGALTCALFLRSAFLVAREAGAELRQSHAQPPAAPDAPQATRRGASRLGWHTQEPWQH
jgi:Co/Zn/Cd efflux system component